MFVQLVHDASSSGDPDFVPSSEGDSDSALVFSWECTVEIAGQGQSCADTAGSPIALAGLALLTLPANSLAPLDSPYHFTVTVSKPGRIPHSSTTQVGFPCLAHVLPCYGGIERC